MEKSGCIPSARTKAQVRTLFGKNLTSIQNIESVYLSSIKSFTFSSTVKRNHMGAGFLVVVVVWMVYHFSGLCGCITEYFIPEVSRNVVISFSRVEVVNKNAEKNAFCSNIFLGQSDPLKMKTLRCLEMWGTRYPGTQHHTPEQWIPNEEKRKTTAALCYATLQAVCCCLRSEFLSFRLIALSCFNFLSPDLSLCLLEQFYVFDSA